MSSIKPINEKARILRETGGAKGGEVKACSPLPKECTTLHAPGIETGYDDKTGKDLCNPYIRDVGICSMWPGQIPGAAYGMNTKTVLPQNTDWHAFCSDWKVDWDKLPGTVTLEQPTDVQTVDKLWDSAVKVRTQGQTGYAYLSDLHIRDNWQDTTGEEPSTGNFWESPDIFFRNSLDDPAIFTNFNMDYHQDPIAGKENWIYARIRNIGQQPIAHAFVKFYICYPWSPNPSWQQIGHGMAHHILPQEVRVVRSMKPYLPPAATEHACLLAMVDSNQDFIKVFNWGPYDASKGPTPEVINVPDDNNVAQRNIKVAAAAYGLGSAVERFSLGMRALRGVFDLEIERPTLPPDVPIDIGFVNVDEGALNRASLSKGVQLKRYSNVVYPWNLRNFYLRRNLGMTYSGLITITRQLLRYIEGKEGGLSTVKEDVLAQLEPISVEMPGITIAKTPNASIRGLPLDFEQDEPLMVEMKIQLPPTGEAKEHRIVIRQYQERKLLGGITLVLRTARPDIFPFFLDTTKGIIHRSGSPTLQGVRKENLIPMHTADRALLFGAKMAEGRSR